jgi:hypothetical protein
MTRDTPLVVDLLASMKSDESAPSTPSDMARLLNALDRANFDLFAALREVRSVD